MNVLQSKISFNELRNANDFKKLTDKEFELLSENVTLRSYKKGQTLFDEGDCRTKFYYVLEGLVRIERFDESATYFYYDYVTNNSIFPLGGIFQSKDYLHGAQALTNILTFCIPVDLFEKICHQNTEQLIYLIHKLDSIFQFHQQRIQVGLTANAHDRVKQNLYILKEELGIMDDNKEHVKIPYPITLKELATNSGTTRETAGLVVKNLQKNGSIEYKNKLFTFL